MKGLLLFFISFSAFAKFDYNQTVPGKNYTYKDYLIQRSFVNQLKEAKKKPELEGSGPTTNSNLVIKKHFNEETKKEEIFYLVFRRNCGHIELSKKEGFDYSKLKDGMRIKYRIQGRSCDIADWEIL